MKIVFEVRSVTEDMEGATVILEEPKDTANPGGATFYELQQLAVYPNDEAEILRWRSRIGKKVCLTVEDL